MQNIYLPFKISLYENVITNIGFKEKDSIWSKNIKRAIASAIQLQGEKMGAYIVSEVCVGFFLLILTCIASCFEYYYNML